MNRTGFVAILSGKADTLPAHLLRFCERLQCDHGHEILVNAAGLLVLGEPRAAHLVLHRPPGILWGYVFDRVTGRRVAQEDVDRLAGLSLDDMLQRYWGGYILIRAGTPAIEVLREPSGAVACYHADLDGRHVITSQPHLLFDHELVSAEIDWIVVAQSLVYRDLRPAQTCLRGISELLPGVILEVMPEATRTRTGWSPWSFARCEAQILDPENAILALRETATMALGAWSDCFVRPLVEISGGLDSSIVAAGLRQRKAEFDCVTFGPEADDASELPWARAVAAHLGVALTELVPISAAVDLTHSHARDLPRPCARVFTQAMDHPLQAIAGELLADGFIGGGGGDSMFCFQHSARPVIDRFLDQGLGLGVFRTAADMAKLARTDIWTVLRSALRQSLRRSSCMPRPQTSPFVRASLKADLPWPIGHPWLEAPRGISPGKRSHVWSIIAMQNHIEGYGRETIAPHIAPLMSQPIFETCLRIPSWHWCIGGNNRAAAREAFRPLLPAAVIDRSTKLSFNSLVRRIIEANRDTIQEMLLHGALAREGLIDPLLLERFLTAGLARGEALAELMALVDTEAWVRSWEGRSGRAAGG